MIRRITNILLPLVILAALFASVWLSWRLAVGH